VDSFCNHIIKLTKILLKKKTISKLKQSIKMSRNEKVTIKSCLTKFCGAKRASDKDYECLPYQKEAPLPIARKPSTPKAIKGKNLPTRRLTHLNKLTTGRNLIHDPVFHSTNIDQNTFTGEFFQHVKIASTYIQRPSDNLSGFSGDSTTYAYSNSDYDSPPSTRFSGSSFCSSTTNSSGSESNFSSVDQYAEIYVCHLPYKAQYDGDISLKYTDRVQVLHATEEFTLVKKINGSECGYVSTSCLTSLHEFIKKF
jgi:hypothetical protein